MTEISIFVLGLLLAISAATTAWTVARLDRRLHEVEEILDQARRH